MDIKENIAGLGKDHDKETQESGNDIAKKQSEAKPAAENLDAEPHSIDKSELKDKNTADLDIKQDADEYAAKEHQKAADFEHTDLKKKP